MKPLRSARYGNRAIIAIARMMLTAIFHCPKNGEFFDPSRYDNLAHQTSNTTKNSLFINFSGC